MGLLSLGTPLDWEQAKHYAGHVRNHGLTQFLNTWDRLKDRKGDELLWGDEVLILNWARSCHDPLTPPPP
jgi:glutamate--cysteine ligase catalytic subunit